MAIGIYFTLHHGEPAVASPGWLMPLAVGVASAGILLAWLTYERQAIDANRLAQAFGPIRQAALAGFWVDAVVLGLYRHGLMAGARVIGWIDRYLVDGVLNVFSAWTVTAGDRLRRLQTGRVQDYVFSVAVGVLAIVIWIGWAR
jgi:NADH-quinone oxidoreductase subunit L